MSRTVVAGRTYARRKSLSPVQRRGSGRAPMNEGIRLPVSARSWRAGAGCRRSSVCPLFSWSVSISRYSPPPRSGAEWRGSRRSVSSTRCQGRGAMDLAVRGEPTRHADQRVGEEIECGTIGDHVGSSSPIAFLVESNPSGQDPTSVCATPHPRPSDASHTSHCGESISFRRYFPSNTNPALRP
jgi:hypothetical protein